MAGTASSLVSVNLCIAGSLSDNMGLARVGAARRKTITSVETCIRFRLNRATLLANFSIMSIIWFIIGNFGIPNRSFKIMHLDDLRFSWHAKLVVKW